MQSAQMQSNQMQPLTHKELDYISDSLSNEEMLAKLCAATAGSAQDQAVRQICLQHLQSHSHHMDVLAHTLQMHQQFAPMQPQQ